MFRSKDNTDKENTMKQSTSTTCVFLDIGGVLLTNGWDHHARKRAATTFELEWAEMENRHKLNFATYEEGKLSLKEYLNRVVFYRKRPFTLSEFWRFMAEQSKLFAQMIALVRELKVRHGLEIGVVSNEARELNSYRIQKLKLDKLVDVFVSSCFVHVRKPDTDIFRLALDIVQVPARQIVDIENTQMFAEIAESPGMKSTRDSLAALGLDCSQSCKAKPSIPMGRPLPGLGWRRWSKRGT